MGWFSDLFNTKDVVTDSGLPKVSNIPPMPKVKPPKPEKNISEPVISFIECVRNNPQRFRIKFGKVLDRKTNTWFISNYFYESYEGRWHEYVSPRVKKSKTNTSWMTIDEIEYATNKLKEIQQEKVKVHKNKQRQKYIEIYGSSK